MIQRKLNLKRAPEDKRDFKFSLIAEPQLAEPRKVDLRPHDMPIEDQGEIGACTGFAWQALHDYVRKQSVGFKGVFKPSSQLFIYNCERLAAGTFKTDDGANMRDGGDVLHDIGVCTSSMFPYGPANLYTVPSKKIYLEADRHKNSTYYALDTIKEKRQCLQSGFPFVIGIDVPEAFMSGTMASTGRMSLADWATKSAGGHAVMAIAYNDDTQEWTMRNSWSREFGDNGYFYMPYSVMGSETATFNAYTLRV